MCLWRAKSALPLSPVLDYGMTVPKHVPGPTSAEPGTFPASHTVARSGLTFRLCRRPGDLGGLSDAGPSPAAHDDWGH